MSEETGFTQASWHVTVCEHDPDPSPAGGLADGLVPPDANPWYFFTYCEWTEADGRRMCGVTVGVPEGPLPGPSPTDPAPDHVV